MNNLIFHYRIFYFIQSVLKYIPFKVFSKIRPLIFRPFFKSIGKDVLIHDNVLFKFPKEISIGNHVKIAQNCMFVGGSGLYIGNNVLIGAGTKIITSSHNFTSLKIPISHQGLSFSPIKIEDDVWFGFSCVILGGTTIRRGCIIGANSVVTKTVDVPFSILAGVPAKLIKHRIEENI